MNEEQKELAGIGKPEEAAPQVYTLSVIYTDGTRESFDLFEHSLKEMVVSRDSQGNSYMTPAAQPFVEYRTDKGIWGWIPVTSAVRRFEFDDRFSVIIEDRKKVQEAEAKLRKAEHEKIMMERAMMEKNGEGLGLRRDGEPLIKVVQ